jgi:hypothetical protein
MFENRSAEERAFIVNQAGARLRRVEALLERYTAKEEATLREATRKLELANATLAMQAITASRQRLWLPERHIAALADINDISIELLWLIAAPYLEPTIQAAVAAANGHAELDHIDPALCLHLLAANADERLHLQGLLQPDSALFDSGLVQLEQRFLSVKNWMRHALVPADHLVGILSGRRVLSASARRYGERFAPDDSIAQLPGVNALQDVQSVLATALRGLHDDEALHGPTPLVGRGAATLLLGVPGAGRMTTARGIAASLGRATLVLEGRALTHLHEREVIEHVDNIAREAWIHGEILVVREADALFEDRHAAALALTRQIERRPLAVVLCAEQDIRGSAFDRVILCRARVDQHREPAHRLALWSALMPEALSSSSLKPLYRLQMTPLQIRRTVQLAKVLSDADTSERLEPLAREGMRADRGTLARVEPARRSLRELILSPDTRADIVKIIAAFSNRGRVLDEWSLGARISRGTGLVCLFNGDPGTGKTMAAEVIAHELGLEMMRVNVATIVSKYIGETEKNLTQVFEQANPELDLLLFDEADALFAQRTTVKGSTDRYSNMEINVLLELVEGYRGIAVLTTNLKQGIDKAFMRRLSFKIDFTVPGVEEREFIWRSLLPQSVPTDEPIDHYMLAEGIELAGGGIKNAVLRAAYHAASQGRRLNNDDLFDAARAEASAEGRLVRDS